MNYNSGREISCEYSIYADFRPFWLSLGDSVKNGDPYFVLQFIDVNLANEKRRKESERSDKATKGGQNGL